MTANENEVAGSPMVRYAGWEAQCNFQWDDWACNAIEGHTGPHVAHGDRGNRALAAHPLEPPEPLTAAEVDAAWRAAVEGLARDQHDFAKPGTPCYTAWLSSAAGVRALLGLLPEVKP